MMALNSAEEFPTASVTSVRNLAFDIGQLQRGADIALELRGDGLRGPIAHEDSGPDRNVQIGHARFLHRRHVRQLGWPHDRGDAERTKLARRNQRHGRQGIDDRGRRLTTQDAGHESPLPR